MIGRFLFNLFDVTLLFLDVIVSTTLVLPELIYSYITSIGHLIAQLICLVAPARFVDCIKPTLRQPKRNRTGNQSDNQKRGHALVHTQRAFYMSHGELFRTEELTIDPIVSDRSINQSTSGPVRQSMSVAPLEHNHDQSNQTMNHPSDPFVSLTTNQSSKPPVNPPIDDSNSIIFFMITGNPGSCHYYTPFLTHLARMAGHTMHIRCVSFAGHQSTNPSINQPDNHPRLYGLADQINLWSSIIKQTLTDHPNCRIVVAGHSIGAYIALHILSLIPASQLLHSYLMFPALMDMARTPDGAKIKPMLQSFRTPIAVLGATLASILPQTVIKILIRANIGSAGDMEHDMLYENEQVVDTTIDLMKFSVIQQMLYLAATELELVTDMPNELIARFESKLTLICAPIDGWNPPSHQHMLAAQFPQLRIRMMPPSVKHAFVIGSSHLVAAAVWRELKQHVDPNDSCTSDSDEELIITRKPLHKTRPLH